MTKNRLLELALGMLLGATAFVAYTATQKATEATAHVKKLEADVRTYAGKYLDLQEQGDEAASDARLALSAAQYELSQVKDSLAICQKKPESKATLGTPKAKGS